MADPHVVTAFVPKRAQLASDIELIHEARAAKAGTALAFDGGAGLISRPVLRKTAFFDPAQPILKPRPPKGDGWLCEIRLRSPGHWWAYLSWGRPEQGLRLAP
jgi:hypothetical protein